MAFKFFQNTIGLHYFNSKQSFESNEGEKRTKGKSSDLLCKLYNELFVSELRCLEQLLL
jgi:hypothetical protein